MEAWFDHVMLSRYQFALTTMFHIIWPLLTIGLSLFLVWWEVCWLKTRDPHYYYQARFWGKLLLLNVVMGVASGVPLEFQFGTNWGRFAAATAGFFGSILGFEATMAFMLEAGFLGIMLFGWRRVPARMHLLATCMVALGASLSAFWIMAANSWMQTPAGGAWVEGRFVLESYWAAVFNPDLFWGFSHMWVACLETTLFVVGGLSAWYLLNGRQTEFFLKSFRAAVVAAMIITPLQIYLGDGSGRTIGRHQPAKVAALEAHWHTNPPGRGAAWRALAWPNPESQDNDWSFLEIPGGLSLLLTHTLTGPVPGLRDFPRQDQPPVLLLFYAFRVMVAIGGALFLLMLWTLWVWRRGGLSPAQVSRQRLLLRAWILAAPLNYLAVEMGWVTREVGRQPWIIYGWMRTADAVSPLPAAAVACSLLAFSLIYTVLSLGFLFFAVRLIRQGMKSSEF